MSDDFKSKFVWIAVLLPGFICVALVRYIASVESLSEIEYVFWAALGSLLSIVSVYLIYCVYYYARHKFNSKETVARIFDKTSFKDIVTTPSFVSLVIFASIAIGIIAGKTYESDSVLAFLRSNIAEEITKRSSQRPLTFLLSQNRLGILEEGRPVSLRKGEAWIQVHLTGGEIFEGYPEFFSLDNKNAELFLSPACQKKKNGRREANPVEGPGVLLYEKEIKYITFLDRKSSDCYVYWESVVNSLQPST